MNLNAFLRFSYLELNLIANRAAGIYKGFKYILFIFKMIIVPLEDKQKNWHSNSGDVKYHIGTSFTRKYPNGKKMTVIGY